MGFLPHYELLQETREDLEQPEWVLPVGEDVSGKPLLRRHGRPAVGQVLFWDHEEASLTPLAASFSAFVEGLEPASELDLNEAPPRGHRGLCGALKRRHRDHRSGTSTPSSTVSAPPATRRLGAAHAFTPIAGAWDGGERVRSGERCRQSMMPALRTSW